MSRAPNYTHQDLVEWAGEDVYAAGTRLVDGRRVKHVTVKPTASGDVWAYAVLREGGKSFNTDFFLEDELLWGECGCGAEGACLHQVALAILALDRAGVSRLGASPAAPTPPPAAAVPPTMAGPPPVPASPPRPMPAPAGLPATGPWRQDLARWQAAADPAGTAKPGKFQFRLRLVAPAGRRSWSTCWDLEMSVSKRYKRAEDFEPLAREAVRAHVYRVGPESQALHRFWGGGGGRAKAGFYAMAAFSVDPLMRTLAELPDRLAVQNEQGERLRVQLAPLVPALVLTYDDEGAAWLQPVFRGIPGDVMADELRLVGTADAPWALVNGAFYPVQADLSQAEIFARPIRVPPAEREELERRILPTLALSGALAGQRPPEVVAGTPRPRLALSEARGALLAAPEFLYGEDRVGYTEDIEVLGPPQGPLWRRDHPQEQAHVAQLKRLLDVPVREAPPFRFLGERALGLLADGLPALAKAQWAVIGQEALRDHTLRDEVPRLSVAVASGIDWFEVDAHASVGDEPLPWPELMAALGAGQRFVRLGSGAFARLPKAWAQQLGLVQRLGLGKAKAARLERYHAPALSRLLDQAEEAQADEAFAAMRARLESFGGIEAEPVPKSFKGTLRPYQLAGFQYLRFLRAYGLHGILADDMGLGKTVQTAALLLANQQEAKGPSLVVAPASVAPNWVRELATFAPKLRVLLLHGPERDLGRIAGHDVVVTTYATARLDLEAHQAQAYDTVILDEAQTIKNPTSQTAHAMRRLPARHRLCLTGTPIENDLADLWSLFAFLLPGLLGKLEDFRSQYAVPIANGNQAARDELKARVTPFILRRLKGQVATDLPARTDMTVWCDLAPPQRRVYDALLAAQRQRVAAAVAERGVAASAITILDALTRLRQACCHPALLKTPETLHLPSGKLEAALELIDELISGGHRALVFSQFTSMLAILREALDTRGIAYAYLDGSTRDRQKRVDTFNQGDAPLFLISLKAGGTGLNLTGADYVLHYDPWWNPAVEDQATDRAHRIGQTRHVFSYKLIARGTIEEKLLALQQRKRALVRDLLEADTGAKRLTREDLAFLFEG
ncbi:MAG: SNF2-related protein [Cyanobacteria bacterium RYN_339]|nr:SNF2-related protein [Cyanobacteria bacterium RYN_339]